MRINPNVLKNIIQTSGVAFKEVATSYIFTCPRCSREKKLYIRKSDGRFVCWHCRETDNFQGKPEYALAELLNLPTDEIKSKLYDDNFKNLPGFLTLDFMDPYDSENELEMVEELPGVCCSPDFVKFNHPLFQKGREYLRSRGMSDSHMEEYGIMYNPSRKAVVFPVIIDGSLVGWQERGIANKNKYTMRGFKKEQALMFQDRLRGSNHAVLCEGPMDAIKAHLCGGNVASMGKGVSKFQIDILKNTVKRIYLALDPDANVETSRICRDLYDHMDIYLLPPPPGKKDLGEATYEEVYEEFKKAKPYCGQNFIYFKE